MARPAPPPPSAAIKPEPAAPRRRGAGLWIGLALAASMVLLLWRPWEKPRPDIEEVAVGLTAVPVARSEPAQPTAPPAPSPAPTAAPTAVPSPPAVTPVDLRPFRQAAESARQAALRARQASEESRARELAPSTHRLAVARLAEAERLFAGGSDGEAKRAFDASARLFGQSRAQAVAAARPEPTPVRVAQLPSPIARPTEALILPTAIPAPPTPLPTAPRLEATRAPAVEREPPALPTPATARVSSEEDQKIRETIRQYERAWSTLDARLYRRVYPSGVEAFELARKNLRSQYVRIEIRGIVVDPSGGRAEVMGHETVVATPRAGDQVQSERDVTVVLQKSGEAWIIVARN
ncbi:MAG: hypothetical protein ACRD3M_13845 [Thermoanaerobaculia bacterium]